MNITEVTSISLLDVIDVVDIAVASLSRRLPAFVSREDLASVGKVALVNFIGRCEGSLDEVRARCFVRVRSAMLDEIRRQDPISRRRRDIVRAVENATDVFESRERRSPSERELAAELGIDTRVVRRAIATIRAATDVDIFDWNTVVDEQAVCPASGAEITELREHLLSVLVQLTSGQALAVHRLYLEDATLEQVANELGVSIERVRQLREAGVAKLRVLFGTLGVWQSVLARKRV